MHGEDLFVDDCCNWEAVEAVSKGLPELNVVPPLALVVEPVYAVDRGAFVVPTEDEEILGVFDLVRKQQADSLKGLLSSVHVISQEEVICLWWESSIFKEAEEIVVLSMNIAANLHQKTC